MLSASLWYLSRVHEWKKKKKHFPKPVRWVRICTGKVGVVGVNYCRYWLDCRLGLQKNRFSLRTRLRTADHIQEEEGNIPDCPRPACPITRSCALPLDENASHIHRNVVEGGFCFFLFLSATSYRILGRIPCYSPEARTRVGEWLLPRYLHTSKLRYGIH